MEKNQKLLPVEERGAFKNIIQGFVLMLGSLISLYYGNMFVISYIERLGGHNFRPIFFGAVFSVLIHSLQILLLLLSWMSIGKGISSYVGRFELTVRIFVSLIGIWITWITFSLSSDLLMYSFPLNIYVVLLLVLLFEILAQQVDNWLDKSAALMLWICSFQSLELLPAFLRNEQATSLFHEMFRTAEEIAMINMAGVLLFLSFMAGAVISTWVLASYSIKLSQVRRLWDEYEEETKEKEDDGLRKISMVEMHNLVHDLKSPLTAIKGMAFAMRDGVKDPSDSALEKIDIMLSATHYMERMVGEILHEEQFREVQVELFFDRLGRHIRPFPWGQDVAVSIDSTSRQRSIALNEIRFTRALLNVLDNAWRANRTAGAKGIELHVRCNAAFLEIEILDNGPGLKQNLAYQKSGWGSTGLGLAFARKIATTHGGSLFLTQRTDAPNGVSVMISLPILNAGLKGSN